MSPSRDPMDYRAGDSDRERTAEALREAAGDGRITLDELDARLSAAYAAVTYADLAELTDDLPPTAAPPAARDDSKPLVLTGTGGEARREGRWRVPSHIAIDRKHGSVRLGCTEATFAASVTTVDLRVQHCAVTVLLPDDATAEIECHTKFTGVKSQVPSMATVGHPHLVIEGQMDFGSLRVRYARGHKRRARRKG